jgi:membrane protein DedA with SNARE-associated domain
VPPAVAGPDWKQAPHDQDQARDQEPRRADDLPRAAGARVLTAADAVGDLSGITGLFAGLIDRTGEVGVGLLTLVETIIPPVPSEIVLPLAGFLAQQGRLAIVWVLVAATLGSLVGAWAFYGLGAALGLERSIALLSRVPLIDREDLEAASDWFHRHGRGSVFFGRFVPGVRSLISLPAGAQRMSWGVFSACTLVGSALWNGLLVGAGYALGTQWSTVGRYVSTASDVVIVLLVVLTVVTLVRRRRRRRSGAPGTARSGEHG